MAGLSDRAKLIAELILLDKLSGPAKTATGSLGKLEGATAKAGRGFSILGGAVSTALGLGLQRAVSIGIGTLSSQIQQGVAGAEKLQSVTVATNQVIASTKGAAGESAAGIRDLALKYEDLNSLIDDKVIQSGENLLLTFTNIRKSAFEPALTAALNLNQALGGGEAGLQGVVIQVGKALQDPVRGLTALRRVGVAFSADQEKQIKALVKGNHLYKAQQVILGELNKEFGGQFAKAGQTSVAQSARLRDAVDDLRISFAQGLLPGINNVRAALIKTFRDPSTKASIAGFGKDIGNFLTPARIQQGIGFVKDAFKGIVGFAKAVPWQAIGTALQIGGTGAKAILSAFASAPPWLQTAIATGWGLNKLSGGTLSGIFGSLASGLIKGVLGINAAVVNINAATVNGGGVPGVGGLGGGLLSTALKSAGVTLAGAFAGFEIGQFLNENKTFGIGGSVAPAKTFEASQFSQFTGQKQSAADIERAIKSIEDNLNPTDFGAKLAIALDVNGVKSTLQGQLAALQKLLPAAKSAELKQNVAAARAYAQRATTADKINGVSIHTLAAANAARSTQAAVNATAARTHAYLSKVAADGASTAASSAVTSRKNFSPTLNNNVQVINNISVRPINEQITRITFGRYAGKLVPSG